MADAGSVVFTDRVVECRCDIMVAMPMRKQARF